MPAASDERFKALAERINAVQAQPLHLPCWNFRAAAVRAGSPRVRMPGKGKGRGFQYPYGVVVGDALWVMYSVGKEDIAISRVPLRSLPR